jgi:hypothetical protein
MNVIDKTRSDHTTVLVSNEKKHDDSKTEKKYPRGPNEKQGYPDEEQPNRDDLHQEHMIEENQKNKKGKKMHEKKGEHWKTFKGWTVIF